MLVSPLPGADRTQVLEAIREVATGAFNLRGSSGADPYQEYVRWANDSAQKLSNLISPADIERLVLTRRYWLLQSMEAAWGSASARILMNAELVERVRDLEAAQQALQQQIDRWSRPGVFVVPDTSFYITHPVKLEDAVEGDDLFGHLDLASFEGVHFLVPIVVIDELDGLKRSRGDVGWRAGYTLAVFDKRLRDPTRPATLRPADEITGTGSGTFREAITVEILFDPPRHARLPINDDEIIDRALAVQVLAGRDLTVVTYDTGQSMRARAAGLRVVKLDVERGPGPPSKTA
jgi:rRNA-processing protein FCF1